MSIVKPYKGLSRNRLTALINEVNGKGRVENVDFTYGLPRAELGPNGENTAVTLTPVPGTSYEGPQDIHYTRLPISVVGELPYNVIEPAFLPTVPFSIKNVLPEINRALGLDLTPDEVVDRQYNAHQSTYILTINESRSLAWVGSIEFQATTVRLTPLDELLSTERDGFVPEIGVLSELIVSNELDGFDPKWLRLDEAITNPSLDGFTFKPIDYGTVDIPLTSVVLNVYLDALDVGESVCADEFACDVY